MDGLDSPSHLPVYTVNMDKDIMPLAAGGLVTKLDLYYEQTKLAYYCLNSKSEGLSCRQHVPLQDLLVCQTDAVTE